MNAIVASTSINNGQVFLRLLSRRQVIKGRFVAGKQVRVLGRL